MKRRQRMAKLAFRTVLRRAVGDADDVRLVGRGTELERAEVASFAGFGCGLLVFLMSRRWAVPGRRPQLSG
jgi:hypothetical protein